MTKMMIDKITGLLTEKVGFESIAIFIGGVILCFFIIWLFIVIAKACFEVERISGKSSHTLLKTVIIALIPTVNSIAGVFDFDSIIPEKLLLAAYIIPCVIVAIWNIIVYGLIRGAMFTVVHIVFGGIASLGVSALIFIAIAAVVLFLFGGSVGGSASTSGGSAPSMVRDVNNGKVYNVVKGVNGELYIEDHGRSCILRSSDYGGEYFDDYGNRYV